jgi:hypothetical protein
MKILKDILVCLLISACSVFFLSLIKLVRDADTTVRSVPAEITATRSALTAEIQSTRRDLLTTVKTQATSIQRTADLRLASIQQMVDSRTAQVLQIADTRTAQALQIADSRLSDATTQVAKVQEDLHPVLANAAASINPKDIQGTVRDTRFLMARAARTAGHIEQMSDAIQKATPEVTQSVVSIGKSADSIAADAKREADDLTKPKHWYDRILGPVYTVGRLVAAFL